MWITGSILSLFVKLQQQIWVWVELKLEAARAQNVDDDTRNQAGVTCHLDVACGVLQFTITPALPPYLVALHLPNIVFVEEADLMFILHKIEL